MNLFHKRPLLLALTFFLALSAITAFAIPTVRFYSVLAFAALALIALLWMSIAFLSKRKHVQKLGNLFLCLLFCFLACFSSQNFFDYKLAAHENMTEPAQIIAEVRECTYSASYLSVYTVAVQKLDGEKANFKASISIDGATDLEAGNVITAEVQFSSFETARYGYNERSINIADGVLIGGTFTEYTLAKSESGSVWHFFENMRNSIAQRIDNGAADSSAALLKAFLLGDRSDLDGSVSLDFRRLGISHILSISGTHFTTLLGMVAVLLSLLGVNKRVIYILLIPLAVAYMALTGFSPAVCRAGIMAVLSYVGLLSGRMRDSYTALFVAVTGILLVQPYTAFSVGLWLSFFATFAILIVLELLNVLQKAAKAAWYTKLLYYVFSHILITVFVSIVTLPIIAVCFGEISILAPVSNLILVPLFSWFLYLAPFTVIFAGFAPLAALTDALYEAIMEITAYLCRADNLLISLKPPFVTLIAILGCVTTLILLALPLKKRGFVLLPSGISLLGIAIGLCIFMHLHYDDTSITYFTVKNNDGIVVTDHNESLYIDISSGASDPAYKASYIAEGNFTAEISGVMFTHYHNNHINQLRKLSNSVNIHAVYLPYTDNADAQNHMYAIADVAKEKDIDIVWFDYDTPIAFASCTVTVFDPEYLSRSTHPVICLEIGAKEQDILYLGSSFNDTDRDLSRNAYLAEYVFYGQHHPVAKNPYTVSSNAYPVYGNLDRLNLSMDKRPGFILETEEGQYEIALK